MHTCVIALGTNILNIQVTYLEITVYIGVVRIREVRTVSVCKQIMVIEIFQFYPVNTVAGRSQVFCIKKNVFITPNKSNFPVIAVNKLVSGKELRPDMAPGQ